MAAASPSGSRRPGVRLRTTPGDQFALTSLRRWIPNQIPLLTALRRIGDSTSLEMSSIARPAPTAVPSRPKGVGRKTPTRPREPPVASAIPHLSLQPGARRPTPNSPYISRRGALEGVTVIIEKSVKRGERPCLVQA